MHNSSWIIVNATYNIVYATNEVLQSGDHSSIDDGSISTYTMKQVPSLKQLPHVPSTQPSSN